MSRLYRGGSTYYFYPYGYYRGGCGRIWGLVAIGLIGFGCIKAYNHRHGYND